MQSVLAGFYTRYLKGVRWFEFVAVLLLTFCYLVLQSLVTGTAKTLIPAAQLAAVPTAAAAILYLRIPKGESALLDSLNAWAVKNAAPSTSALVGNPVIYNLLSSASLVSPSPTDPSAAAVAAPPAAPALPPPSPSAVPPP